MQISFEPCLGDAVSVTTLFTMPLLFTAQLNAHDHDLLAQASGRVQLWSDIPQGNNGEWSGLDFEYASDPAMPASGACTVSLRRNPLPKNREGKFLRLFVFLSPTNSATRQFSFTYRILYPSGAVTWLGAFGQNGSLIVQQSLPSVLKNIVLQPGWDFDHSRRARVIETKDNEIGVQVAKLHSFSDFQVWALGTQSIMHYSQKTSILFLVPRIRGNSVTVPPTYILATSPGTFMTLSEEGALNVFGSGTVLLQTYEPQAEMRSFLDQIIEHSKLDYWNILGTDPHSKTLILAAKIPQHPVQAVVIPLWSSDYMPSSHRLNSAQLANLWSGNETQDFALFSLEKLELHYFSQSAKRKPENQDIVLEIDSTGSDFLVHPIERLVTQKKTLKGFQKTWATAILAPYTQVSSANLSMLPTPPLSPHPPKRFLSFSQPASAETSILTTASSPSETAIAEVDSHGCQDSEVEPDATVGPSPLVNPRPQNLFSAFKSIFASVGVLLRFFFRVFWCPVLPFGRDRTLQSPGLGTHEEAENPEVGDLDGRLTGPNTDPDTVLKESTSGFSIPAEKGVPTGIASGPENGDMSRNTADLPLPEGEAARLSVSRTESLDIQHEPDNLEPGGILYAELIHDWGDTPPSRSSFGILLMSFTSEISSEGVDMDAIDTPTLNGGLERAIRFLDGSSPHCIVSKVDSFSDRPAKDSNQLQVPDVCYLLQYQLNREGMKKGSVISISVPEV